MNNVHIGTMGWSYNFWKGNFYPENLVADQFLTEYSKHFETVEVDSTFYRVPYENTVTKWRDQVLFSRAFLFAVKFPKVITHEKMLKNCDEEVAWFIERMSKLQDKLGPLLLQLPPTFKPEYFERLSDFISSLPKEYRYAVEIRNKKLLTKGLYSLLRENGIASTIADSPLIPTMEEATTDFAYIRWEGDRNKVNGTLGKTEINRTRDIEKWAKIIKHLQEKATAVFGYFSKYYSGHPPTDAKELLKSLEIE